MDNFFEILIYLFIIVSFINSFFKKKKKENDKTEQKDSNSEMVTSNSYDREEENNSGNDILEEIQTLFNTEVEKPEQQTETSFNDLWNNETYSEHHKTPDEHSETKSEHNYTYSEHIHTKSEHRIPYYEKPEKIKVRRLLDDNDEKQEVIELHDQNDIAHNIKEHLKDRDTFINLFIAYEIIGKPKALRR